MTTYLYRGISAAILVVAVLYVLDAGGLVLFLTCLVTTWLGVYEFVNIVRQGNHRPSLLVSLLLATGLVCAPYFDTRLAPLALTLALGTTIFWLRLNERALSELVSDWALTFLASIYIGGILQYGIALRALPNGWTLGLLTLVGTWICDTGAYLVGTRWGRRKFAPLLSPHKTWEGTVGGFVSSFLVVLGMGMWLGVAWWHAASLGVLIPIAAVLGDLTESLLKRSNGVKDSGNLIPGHGGLLDRIDSLLFVVLTVYVYAVWFIR